MTPFEVWKKNKGRCDLRKYTRKFEENFKVKSSLTEVGNVYAISYRANYENQTDKHHITPVILSFGRFLDDNGTKYVRGLNLLYLKTNEAIDILNEVYAIIKKPADKRVPAILKIHSKYMTRFPYAFKNFEERRILTTGIVNEEEWGMIPLLHKHLFGTFNAVALNEDFQKEIKNPKIKPKKVKEQKLEEEEEFETIELDDDLDDDFVVNLDTD